MNVIALETDQDQVATLRQIVCELAGAGLTVLESVDQLIQALVTEKPELILLPPLLTPADDNAVLALLRILPAHAHIETMIIPTFAKTTQTTAPVDPFWRRLAVRRSNTADVVPPADPVQFAERVVWALDHVRETREAAERAAAELPFIASEFSNGQFASALLVEPPPSLVRLLTAASESTQHEIQMADARMLQRLERERRVHRRFAVNELSGVRAARIRFGPNVSLIDVSAGGALLESETRLHLESEALLELEGIGRPLMVPFRVLRCDVATGGQSARYRGACAFKIPLDVSGLVVRRDGFPASDVLVVAQID
jgi:hypothetical protein